MYSTYSLTDISLFLYFVSVESFRVKFTTGVFYYLQFSGRVFNKKSNRGPSLHLPKEVVVSQVN